MARLPAGRPSHSHGDLAAAHQVTYSMSTDNKTDIIFSILPAYLDPFGRGLRWLGYNVFYVSLASAGSSPMAEKQRVRVLREGGIVPLPLAQLPRLEGVRYTSSRGNKLKERINKFVPVTLLCAIGRLYPNNVNIVAKLHTAVHAMIYSHVDTENYVNFWAAAHPGRRHLLINLSTAGLLSPQLASNVRLLAVPVDMFSEVICLARKVARKVLRVVTGAMDCNGAPAVVASPDSRSVLASRVAFVPHQGLCYGNLFQKTLWYSHSIDSELHPENLLHLDYSGYQRPSEDMKWVCLGRQGQVTLLNLYYAMIAMCRGIFHVRRFRQIIGLLLLAKIYGSFKSYSKELEAYPELRLALIDYEILCPKALLLAFESRNVKTIAAQERFVMPFSAATGVLLDVYLCGSEFVAEVMRRSSAYCVDQYVSVGQYRSDNLVNARLSEPPKILEVPIVQGRKVITVLGFDTCLDWHNSQTDCLLNWMAHRQFLEEMVQLSRDIPNVFIILRFKHIGWVSLPVFAEAVREIQSLENMVISMDYEKSFISYDFCAHSDLVIAKHTSLGDECLAVGIPVLFHEYTHNTKRLVADAFDYGQTRIMCFTYQELLERSKIILSGDPHAMTPDYEYLERVVYGGLGDGKVRKRIHAHIESLLKE